MSTTYKLRIAAAATASAFAIAGIAILGGTAVSAMPPAEPGPDTDVAAAAKYLALARQKLRAKLARTGATIANGAGKSKQGPIAAIVTAERRRALALTHGSRAPPTAHSRSTGMSRGFPGESQEHVSPSMS
jgi:hypothetical protein